MELLHKIGVIPLLGGLLVVVAFIGLIRSSWRPTPKSKNLCDGDSGISASISDNIHSPEPPSL
ncbi:MAG TPA: hypothetical protein VM661_08220 [Candidatus Sulfotelmatobacter sp.]|jgi:hypothetical protein|nr:hypothetical protein [Candidatus Sulfotelmatobacter sp.]